MMLRNLAAVALSFSSLVAYAQQYDSVVGDVLELEEPTPHWFALRAGETGYLIDGDEGTVEGTLTLSMFSPAIEPHLSEGRIYSYGSFYTRTYYGDRTDVVLIYDLDTAQPVSEVEIPPKSAGIGHSGMIGLIDDRFVGVWNITPAMSVSIVDVEDERFVSEISTPGCAGVYAVERGFLMACGDGRVQYVSLDRRGEEADRVRSDVFFDVMADPVYDYAVPTADGWLFMTLEGQVFEVTVDDGEVVVSEPWSVNPPDEEDAVDLNGVPIEPDDDWRIGGRQPFAYNAEHNLLVTLMHEGGGQETFEDAGTEIWAFNVGTQRRGFRLELEEGIESDGVQLTRDAEPLLLLSPSGSDDLMIYDGLSGRHLRDVTEVGSGLIQNLD